MNKNTQALAYLNNLKIETFRKANKEQLKDMVYFLNRSCKITFKEMSEAIGVPISTIHMWACAPSQSNTQNTHRMVRKGLDIGVLSHHFSLYIPKDEAERQEIRHLVVVLMDCVKR